MDVGRPRFPRNLGEIAGDPSARREIPIRILIAAKDSPFHPSTPFRPSARGGDIILNSADP